MTRDDAPKHEIKEALAELEHRIELGIRYHQRRRLFFDRLHATLLVISIFSSSGAVATYLAADAPGWLKVGVLLVLALFQALALAVRPDQKAREHARLATGFVDSDRVLKTLASNTPADVRQLTQRVLEVERDEPPMKRVLMAIVHNDCARRMGSPDRIPVTRVQAALANFVDLRPEKLEAGAR